MGFNFFPQNGKDWLKRGCLKKGVSLIFIITNPFQYISNILEIYVQYNSNILQYISNILSLLECLVCVCDFIYIFCMSNQYSLYFTGRN